MTEGQLYLLVSCSQCNKPLGKCLFGMSEEIQDHLGERSEELDSDKPVMVFDKQNLRQILAQNTQNLIDSKIEKRYEHLNQLLSQRDLYLSVFQYIYKQKLMKPNEVDRMHQADAKQRVSKDDFNNQISFTGQKNLTLASSLLWHLKVQLIINAVHQNKGKI